MKRTLTYQIDKNESELRIEQVLKRKGCSQSVLTQLKKHSKQVLVNQSPIYMNQKVHTGDILTVHLPEDTPSPQVLPVCLPLDILYEDEDIIVVNKSAGMPTHPSQNNRDNTLANALAWYYQEQGKPFVFRCANRLDRDTSGVTVISKHMLSAAILSSQTAKHAIRKEYLAIVRGAVTPAEGTIAAPLGRKPGSIIERIIDKEHGEHAVTHYRVVKIKDGYSLVSLLLETGRTHQIRIHMKHLGFPLIGDYLYNPDMERIQRQALHSYRMTFSHPITGKPVCFTAPLPADMAGIID